MTNPRYTGRQVWNRQRKDEVLLDVHDVALGHTTKMRWNDQDKWIFSDAVVAPADHRRGDLPPGPGGPGRRRAPARAPASAHRPGTPTCWAACCSAACATARCKATGPTTLAYYRCRFPAEYALANKLQHPRNVFVREDEVLARLDAWLARQFDPARLPATIEALAASQQTTPSRQPVTALP